LSLQQLIELSKIKNLSPASQERLAEARRRHRDFDEKIERQVANKRVGHELLSKTCSI
jgi:hypothetical protein